MLNIDHSEVESHNMQEDDDRNKDETDKHLITEKEVGAFIRRMKKGKVPGGDEIPVEVMKIEGDLMSK